ncbi:PH domain-containing protein [Sphingomicrobium astaxanthinifaciens]|uniref:PH domain-containing protein n=1 Tax=Sphingomicrobium astaxanthinifaciens TaxID=1227949 RepID=UPI001FCB08D1|nr:PH domain-containing protein [Sphingomicrobium astaxanthinifaciens]MCJ7420861.1 PH domain-containing protein [Sphingomicrobium astaxanthinifaciens]
MSGEPGAIPGPITGADANPGAPAPAHADAAAPPPRERLHPLSLVAGLGTVFKQAWAALAGGIFLAAQGQTGFALLLVGVATLGTLGSIAVRLLSFSYRIDVDEIDLASGIINRNERSIPFDRVQDVNIEQNPIARLIGLARVKLETGASAGAKDEDGVLDSITLARAEALRDRIRAHRAGAPGAGLAPASSAAASTAEANADAETEAIFAMTPRRLLQLSVFSFSLAIVGALFGVAQTYGDALGLDPFDPDFWRANLERVGPLQNLVLANRAVTAGFGIVTLLLAGLLTGFVRTVPREWGFTLTRTETGFRRRRGLLTLTDVVLPLKRVQAAIVASGPVRRHFDFAKLTIQSLARDSGSGDHSIAPLATGPEIERIIAAMGWPALPDEGAPWQRPSRAFIASGLVPAAIFLLLPAVVVTAIILGRDDWAAALGGAGPTQFSLLAAGLWLGAMALLSLLRILDWRHRRHCIADARLYVRRGWWRRGLVILPLDRIQSVDLRRPFWKRWFGIADLRFGVAGGSGFAAHRIEALRSDEAYALRNALLEPVR